MPPGTVRDGELVVWAADAGDGGRLDFSELQRRLAAPARAATRARVRPAGYVAFDVLQLAGRRHDGEPLPAVGTLLERLGTELTPPLQVGPATSDPATARTWPADHAAADVTIEGLVDR